jgi:hypothetical protein
MLENKRARMFAETRASVQAVYPHPIGFMSQHLPRGRWAEFVRAYLLRQKWRW